MQPGATGIPGECWFLHPEAALYRDGWWALASQAEAGGTRRPIGDHVVATAPGVQRVCWRSSVKVRGWRVRATSPDLAT